MTTSLAGLAAGWLAEWRALSVEDLQFWHRDTAALALIALLACTVVALAIRLLRRPRPGREGIVLPALPTLLRVSVVPWRASVFPPFDVAQGAPSDSRGARH